MEIQRKDSHTIAIRDYDGHVSFLEADEVRLCVPTSKCIKFWVTVASCLVAIGIGIFFMVFQGTASAYFFIGEGLLGLGIGVLIPGPKYETIAPRHSIRPAKPEVPVPPMHDSMSEL